MLTMPNGYREQTAFTGGFDPLPTGGYVCKILGIRTENKDYGTLLTIMFDIIEADSRIIDKPYRSYFNTIYQSRRLSDPDAKWPAGGLHHISLPAQISSKKDQNMLGFFKGFIEAVKSSNPGFVCGFDTGNTFDEQTLKGMLFGGVFGREQYQSDGEVRWSTKIMMVRSVDTIKNGEYKVPDDKYLPQGSTPSYTAPPFPNNTQFEEIGADEGFPF